jgi:hypothetical protein
LDARQQAKTRQLNRPSDHLCPLRRQLPHALRSQAWAVVHYGHRV